MALLVFRVFLYRYECCNTSCGKICNLCWSTGICSVLGMLNGSSLLIKIYEMFLLLENYLLHNELKIVNQSCSGPVRPFEVVPKNFKC